MSDIELATGASTGPASRRAVREILEAIGEDPDRDGLRRHARRGWRRCTTRSSPGCARMPRHHLEVTFAADHDEMVMVKDIPLY